MTGPYAADEEALTTGETMLAVVDEVRRWKAARALSVGAPLTSLTIGSPAEQVAVLNSMRLDLASITRAGAIQLDEAPACSVYVEE